VSNLENHAKFELERAGMFDKDSDYHGMLGESTMRLIKTFASEGHSGFSAQMQIELFRLLASFKTLTPITNNPNEWMEVSKYAGSDQKGIWQNTRDSSNFSNDGGKTYYSVDDKERKIIVAKDDKGDPSHEQYCCDQS
jgi:hypothetical protein